MLECGITRVPPRLGSAKRGDELRSSRLAGHPAGTHEPLEVHLAVFQNVDLPPLAGHGRRGSKRRRSGGSVTVKWICACFRAADDRHQLGERRRPSFFVEPPSVSSLSERPVSRLSPPGLLLDAFPCLTDDVVPRRGTGVERGLPDASRFPLQDVGDRLVVVVLRHGRNSSGYSFFPSSCARFVAASTASIAAAPEGRRAPGRAGRRSSCRRGWPPRPSAARGAGPSPAPSSRPPSTVWAASAWPRRGAGPLHPAVGQRLDHHVHERRAAAAQARSPRRAGARGRGNACRPRRTAGRPAPRPRASAAARASSRRRSRRPGTACSASPGRAARRRRARRTSVFSVTPAAIEMTRCRRLSAPFSSASTSGMTCGFTARTSTSQAAATARFVGRLRRRWPSANSARASGYGSAAGLRGEVEQAGLRPARRRGRWPSARRRGTRPPAGTCARPTSAPPSPDRDAPEGKRLIIALARFAESWRRNVAPGIVAGTFNPTTSPPLAADTLPMSSDVPNRHLPPPDRAAHRLGQPQRPDRYQWFVLSSAAWRGTGLHGPATVRPRPRPGAWRALIQKCRPTTPEVAEIGNVGDLVVPVRVGARRDRVRRPRRPVGPRQDADDDHPPLRAVHRLSALPDGDHGTSCSTGC